MESGETASNRDPSETLERWSARKVQPVVIIYVVVVFAVFIALAIFVFHSAAGAKALVIAAVGGVAASVPGVIEKVEYQLTDVGIKQRRFNTKRPGRFDEVFRWDQLSRVVPMKHGLKYFKTVNETNPLRRFWKVHISDRFSGEVHVERKDLERILRAVERQGIAIPGVRRSEPRRSRRTRR